MGQEWDGALGISITEVVFKALSVRSANTGPGAGGERGTSADGRVG